jgi:hypothetical protein
MKTLDKSRPYGTICGGQSRAAFEQDGLLFDVYGNEIVAKVVQESTPEPAPEPEKEKPETMGARVMRLYDEGRDQLEIRRMTGYHYKSIEKILRDAGSEPEGEMD